MTNDIGYQYLQDQIRDERRNKFLRFVGAVLILVAFAIGMSCAHSDPPSTPASQLAARFARASTKVACIPGGTVSVDCVDDQGLVWTACAWNGCGWDATCRAKFQASNMAGSCGEPEYPACPIRKVTP